MSKIILVLFLISLPIISLCLLELYYSHKVKTFELFLISIILFYVILFVFVLSFKNDKPEEPEKFSVLGGPSNITKIGNTNNFSYTGTDGISNLYGGNSNTPEFETNQISIATILNNL
jgi:hypothetical protein